MRCDTKLTQSTGEEERTNKENNQSETKLLVLTRTDLDLLIPTRYDTGYTESTRPDILTLHSSLCLSHNQGLNGTLPLEL